MDNHIETDNSFSLCHLVVPAHRFEKLGIPFSAEKSFFVWVDCEMSGMDKCIDHILEIACIVTDANLNVIECMHNSIVVHHPKHLLDNMDAWNLEHHTHSGLVDQVCSSTITMLQAEQMVLDFITRYVENPHTGILVGNSIHIDREFLCKDMPRVVEYLSYRIIDVSTIAALVNVWCPSVYAKRPVKRVQHRALDDILESLAELVYYKNSIFDV